MHATSTLRPSLNAAASIAALLLLVPANGSAATVHQVTGTVNYLSHTTLPHAARVWVSLQDVSKADAPSTLIAHTMIRPAGPLPLPFAIAYDPAAIDAGHSYAVRASVIVDGVTKYTTDQAYPVITRGHPSVAHVTLAPATTSVSYEHPTPQPVAPIAQSTPAPEPAQSAAGSPTLESTAWQLTSVNGTPFAGEAAQQPYLQFDATEHHLSGFSGCNRLVGGYTLNGSSLDLGHVGSTMMACPPGVENTAFVAALSTVTTYAISGNTLTLYAGTKPVITMEPKSPTAP